jgi:hypothetical protein
VNYLKVSEVTRRLLHETFTVSGCRFGSLSNYHCLSSDQSCELSGELQAAIEKNNLIAADLQASIRRTEPELVTLKESASGLGEIYDNDPIACGQTLVCCETLNGAGRI